MMMKKKLDQFEIDKLAKKGMDSVPKAKEQFLTFIQNIMESNFNLSELYYETNDLNTVLEQIYDLKKSLDSFRPLEGLQIEKLDKYFDEVYTFDSTGIEGNTLTLQETALVINKGVTIGGKSMREHFEIINHKEAIDYIKEIVRNKEPLNKRILLDIHHLILKNIDPQNSGKYRNGDVMISGSSYKPPTFLQVENLMEEYFDFYKKNKDTVNPVILSADMHEKLVSIHPFIDGNGRTSRLIMNLILLQNGYPITNISSENNLREDYYNSLEIAQTKDNIEDFHIFVAKNVKQALIKYLEVISVNNEPNNKGEYFYNRVLELSKKIN